MLTSNQVIELAESLTGVLREDQLKRILKIADALSEDQLTRLHAKLTELQAVHIEAMKKEIDVRQRMNAEFEAYKKRKKTAGLKKEEAKERAEADAEADRLLEELNSL